MTLGSREVLGRLFNAFWREALGDERRLERGPGGDTIARVRLNGCSVTAKVQQRLALDRLAVSDVSIARNGASVAARRPKDVIALLKGRFTAGALRQFQAECEQSADNIDFLRRRAKRSIEHKTKGFLAHEFGLGDVSGISPDARLEGWILAGHELHPGTKTRRGFSVRDLLKYSPELQRRPKLRFIAVRRDYIIESGSPYAADYPPTWQRALDRELERRGLELTDYAVLPCHPWQFDHVIKSKFARELRSRILVPLRCRFAAASLASLRTMVPSAREACHLKIPIAIQVTSGFRAIPPCVAQDGPAVSTWLCGLMADPTLRRTPLRLLREPRGMRFCDARFPAEDLWPKDKGQELAVVFRERPRAAAGEWVVPSFLLPETSPADGRPVVCELVGRRRARALAFFAEYAAVTAKAVLALLARGVSLEAHNQNILVSIRKGRPTSVFYRDFDGLRLYKPWLPAFAGKPAFHQASRLYTRSLKELASSTQHAWIQGNLAPLATALSRAYSIPEDLLWLRARRALEGAWSAVTRGLSPRQCTALERIVFAPKIRVAALSRMRVSSAKRFDDWVAVPNPLR